MSMTPGQVPVTPLRELSLQARRAARWLDATSGSWALWQDGPKRFGLQYSARRGDVAFLSMFLGYFETKDAALKGAALMLGFEPARKDGA